ncbi:hypothetical protein [Bradyrhizobium acaciae]|uniref:hypothetical protein n=1 Tax=Bradyrhizobium acaciae TaxID=2683706 RepID=UPI001E41B3EE|nr:hypothetical protein [Bradyrhizobium acaciae]MCC8982147.1 hypothetical protein [Bradyrhizobium acaciae]
MFRKLGIVSIAAGMIAIGATATPASASSKQVFGGRNEQILAHYRPITSIGLSPYRFPGKKKR